MYIADGSCSAHFVEIINFLRTKVILFSSGGARPVSIRFRVGKWWESSAQRFHVCSCSSCNSESRIFCGVRWMRFLQGGIVRGETEHRSVPLCDVSAYVRPACTRFCTQRRPICAPPSSFSERSSRSSSLLRCAFESWRSELPACVNSV